MHHRYLPNSQGFVNVYVRWEGCLLYSMSLAEWPARFVCLFGGILYEYFFLHSSKNKKVQRPNLDTVLEIHIREKYKKEKIRIRLGNGETLDGWEDSGEIKDASRTVSNSSIKGAVKQELVQSPDVQTLSLPHVTHQASSFCACQPFFPLGLSMASLAWKVLLECYSRRRCPFNSSLSSGLYLNITFSVCSTLFTKFKSLACTPTSLSSHS